MGRRSGPSSPKIREGLENSGKFFFTIKQDYCHDKHDK